MFACTRPVSGARVGSSSPNCSKKGAVSLTVCTWQCWAFIPFLGKIQWINLQCLRWFQLIGQSLHLNRTNLATAQSHMRSVTGVDMGKNMFSMLPLLCQQQEQILHLLYFHPYGKFLLIFPGNLFHCGSPLSCLKLVHLLCR